jgi:hypothetical protein
MKQNENGAMIASTEAVEAIKDFLQDFASCSGLYKELSLCQAELFKMCETHGIDMGHISHLIDLFDNHFMMIGLLEPFMNSDEKESTEA